MKRTTTLHNTPSGSVDLVSVELAGQEFRLISAGPMFKFTPAVSFMLLFETKEEVDAAWRRFSKGGSALMELGSYPFSERYDWLRLAGSTGRSSNWALARGAVFAEHPVAPLPDKH